jgi:hypothetical protein
MFIFAEDMDSKALEQLRGRISRALPTLSLIIANGGDADDKEVHETGFSALHEVEEMVIEGLHSHEDVGLNLGEEVQEPEEEVEPPDQVVIVCRPEDQEPIEVFQDAGKKPPELLEAIRIFRRALRANGYGCADLDPLISTIRRIDKDPAAVIRGVAKTLLSRAQSRDCPVHTAPEAKLQTPVHEGGKLWKHEDEKWEDEELYWADKFKDAKFHQMATETVSFMTRRKLSPYFQPQISSS